MGSTGVGKSWLACALGHKACRDGRRVLYHRIPRLFEALALARGDGRHARMLKAHGYRAMWAAQGEADVRTVVDTARLAPNTSVFGTILTTVTA